jgi:surface antigen
VKDNQKALISAYHDGELDPDVGAEARRIIDSDPEVRRYFEGLGHADEALRQALDPVLARPVPKSIELTVQRLTRRDRYSRWMPAALAASVALIAMLLVRQANLDRQLHDQLMEMQQEIAQLRNQTLENTPSGTSASWVAPAGKARVEVMPVKSYRTPDNRYCREYEERIEDAAGVEIRRGIACRTGKARWPEEPALSSTNPGAASQGVSGDVRF